MAIIRNESREKYTVIDNAIFKNKDISLLGRGMLTTLLSLPDNWEFSENGLETLFDDSLYKIKQSLNELERLGYLKRIRVRNDKGQLKNSQWFIYEKPIFDLPTLVQPILAEPILVDLPQSNTNISNTNLSNTKEEINNSSSSIGNLFEFLEKAFGRTFNAIEYELIETWEDSEITRYAIKQAVLNNARNLKYVDTIIRSLNDKGIKTEADAIKQAEEFKKRNKGPKKYSEEWWNNL